MTKRWVVLFSLLLLPLILGCATPLPAAPPPAEAGRVRILRDRYGIPHVFGERDADVAFGLAWAHAEDDFPTIQHTIVMERGRMGELEGPDGARSDYFVALLRIHEQVEDGYQTQLSPEFRAVAEAYANGLNFYAERHPQELALPDLLPFRGQDIVAGFVHKMPFFEGLLDVLGPLSNSAPAKAQARASGPEDGAPTLLGSNAFAIARTRSSDGRTHLAVNSHQPWDGPVAWYEAQLHSDEGWDASGGLFPGSPAVLHGHNARLGWAHTVNRPDLIDAYRLEIDPADPQRYRLDGAWRAFERRDVPLHMKLLGFLPWTTTREARWSVQGPVLELGEGDAKAVYAFRIAGTGDLRAAEQWWRMNKARDREQWLDAMRMNAIPMFNTAYADADGHIGYVYNARLPERDPSFDWSGVLPGDMSQAIWTSYLPFDALPQVQDPPRGFVQNANSTPFTASGPGTLDPAAWPASLGIETGETERSFRLLALLGDGSQLSPEAFEGLKWDQRYDGRVWVDDALAKLFAAQGNADVAEAQALLRRWDGTLPADSREGALAILALTPFEKAHNGRGQEPEDAAGTLADAASTLRAHFGRLDPPLAEVQRLRRGSVDLGLGGGPDVVAATYATLGSDGRLVGHAGDCFIMLVDFGPDGAHSRAVHQYGSSSRPDSPHYADQASLFVRHELRPVWRTLPEIRANLDSEYRPGEAPGD